MTKILFLILVLVTLAFVGFQVYKLYAERKTLIQEEAGVRSQLSTLEGEQANLNEEIVYFSDIRNLAKELKSLFNYKKPGEKMMIIIPQGGQ